MHRLFVTIFLWFWVTAWCLLGVVFLGSHLRGLRQVSAPDMYATVAPILAAEAAKTYESGGPEAFARFSHSDIAKHERQLFLLDGFYQDVLSRRMTSDGLRVAHAAKNGQLVILRNHIAAYRFVSASGHPYVLMLYLKSGLLELFDALFHEGVVYTASVISLVTMLCLALAYHIAAPIHGIQITARRVAQGDLKARVPALITRRFDELSALAKDFDSMVGRLDSLIQSQKSLLNSVSHELRSPLARINLSLALLKKKSLPEQDDLFHRLERDVARIDLLMGQLLTLSRLEGELSSAQREEVNLTQILEEAVADGNFEAQASGKSVTLCGSVSVFLSDSDPGALRSACENIIRNAVRFTKPGSEVQVALELDENVSQSFALITVRDLGPGVPENALQAIFQPFYRLGTENGIAEGNGLGLAIASEAIRQHRGTITAANLKPAGLQISIRVPFAAHTAKPSTSL